MARSKGGLFRKVGGRNGWWLALFGVILFAVLFELQMLVDRAGKAGEAAALSHDKMCSLPMGPQEGDADRAANHGNAPPRTENGEATRIDVKLQPDGSKVKTVLFGGFVIDRLYPSMTGPTKVHHVLFGDEGEKNVWVRRYRAEVLDEKSGEASQEYLCHASLDLVGMPNTEADRYHRQELTISQGQKEIVFPKGMALRFANDPLVENHVLVMVLNNNDRKVNRKVSFKTTVEYMNDREAERNKIIPLFQTGAALFPPMDGTPKPGEVLVKSSTQMEVARAADGVTRTGHWLVPPGRQVIAQDVTSSMNIREDTTLHYMWMHVHPYAVSVELRDKTTQKTVWLGKVQNDPDKRRAALLSTDHFESVEGVPLYKDHQYELVSVYDNPTDHEIDAMASLWMYAKSTKSNT